MKKRQGGIVDRLAKEAIGRLAESGEKKEEVLAAGPYLEFEEAETGEILYCPSTVSLRRFWYRSKLQGFPHNLNHGVSWERGLIADNLAIEMKRVYGSGIIGYYLSNLASKRQELEAWAYGELLYWVRSRIEWNHFCVVHGSLIFELQAYIGDNSGNTIINFIFYNKADADKLVLPSWAEGFVKEITDDPAFSDKKLARNGFPKP
ncbi:hypothetical protein KJ784_00215 [Patescibacteria group bacterium]|nr:hypothetical protein [Patescibacteria group bacterium]